MDWDVFISYAGEDKSFVRKLAKALQKRGLKIWFAEFSLSVGDNLRRSIDHGLSNSKYGVVVLSHHFFAKEWPQKELDGLAARECSGEKVILPIWHNIAADQIKKYSPTLADRIAVSSDLGLAYVVQELLRAMGQSSIEWSLAKSHQWTKKTIAFYFNFLIIAFFSVLMGSAYPYAIEQTEVLGMSSLISEEVIITLYLLIILIVVARMAKSSWVKFIEEKDPNYRLDIVATLIFAFFFVILNSGLFVSANINFPLYQFFLGKSNYTNVTKWTFIINCSIATASVIIFSTLNWLFTRRYGKDVSN
ncbi:MAG: toll/interleukin-1 receptor domain-containing protein, partial [Nitrosopumilaceae archaeon]